MSTKELTNEQIEIISKTVLDFHEEKIKEDKKMKSDKYFRNVKKLLKNYRKLKAYSGSMQNLINRFESLQEAFGFGEVEFPVSLSKHKNKTVIFMEYVDSNLEVYRKLCENGTKDEQQRWEILFDMYLSEQKYTADEITEKYFLTKSKPYKEVNKACRTLVILFFGIDGLEDF